MLMGHMGKAFLLLEQNLAHSGGAFGDQTSVFEGIEHLALLVEGVIKILRVQDNEARGPARMDAVALPQVEGPW